MPSESDAITTPATPPKRTLRLRARRVIIFLLVLYPCWCLTLYLLQDKMLFLSQLAGPPLPESTQPKGGEPIWATLDDGSHVEARFFRASRATEKSPAPTVFFAHGNAELIDHQDDIVESYLSRGINVLLAEYPGYGRSTGSASQKTIGQACEAFYQQLIKKPEVDIAHLIFHGRSVGTGVVSQLAKAHPPAAMVLESPFRSVASFSWRYGVPPLLVKNTFHTDEVLPNLNCPIVILHGKQDVTVPIQHGRELAKIAKEATLIELDTSHNDDALGGDPRCWRAIDAMLFKISGHSHSNTSR